MSLLVFVALAGALVQSSNPPAAVAGRVVQEDGSAIAGAQVTLSAIGPRQVPLPSRPYTSVTDQDGRYAFETVDPGRYQIAARKAGFAEFGGSDVIVVDVAPGQRHGDVDLVLQRGGAIAGRVLDERGEPVARCRVTAMRRPPSQVPAAVRERFVLAPAGPGAETNDLGEFRVYGLPAGEYYLQVAAPGVFGDAAGPSGRAMLTTYYPGTSDVRAALPVSVAPGETTPGIELRMLSAPAFQVSGVVVDEAGGAVENAVVRLIPNETDEGVLTFGRWHDLKTDAGGRFAVTSVTRGKYIVLAIAPVVTSGPASPRSSGAVAAGGSFVSGFFSGAGGRRMGGIRTEYRDGVTTTYRDDDGTRVPITVEEADVSDVRIVVRRPGQ